MNLIELDRALKQLRLGGIAAVLEPRLLQAQSEHMATIDLISMLVSDELRRRADRLLERRTKQAGFRDAERSLDSFDFDFNKKMNRRIVYELAAGHFITKHEDALFLGPPGSGKSHLAQALGRAAIQQGHRVLYREAHVLIEEIADATIDGTRKDRLDELATVPLLIIDDLGMRKLPATAAEDLLELVMRRYGSCRWRRWRRPDLEGAGQRGPSRARARTSHSGRTLLTPEFASVDTAPGATGGKGRGYLLSADDRLR
jgi:DNA replication protein DnaC